MAKSKGFGVSSSTQPRSRQSRATEVREWQGMPQLDLEARIELGQAGLLRLRLPDGIQPRSLTSTEKHWLDRAAAAKYITPEQNGQKAIFYTSAPPDFCLEAADWYLCPNDYWNQLPTLLKAVMAKFPAELFKLSASGQPPAFYPDRTPDYTDEQEAVMRSIFRETVRFGWSLPQYKWLVMEQFRKTTSEVTLEEAKQTLEILLTITGKSF